MPRLSAADVLTIDMLSASYTTTVSNQVWSNGSAEQTNTTRTGVGNSPFGDALNLLDGVESIAAADLFGVEVYTQAFPANYPDADGRAQASAMSTLQFRPTETGTAPIAIELAAQFRGLLFSSTSVSLFDLSAGELRWSYSWGAFPEQALATSSVVPIAYSDFHETMGPCFRRCFGLEDVTTHVATLILPTLLDSTHLYSLGLFASTSADKDSEYFRATVSGVKPVPEPASLALFGTGMVCAGIARRRAKLRSSI